MATTDYVISTVVMGALLLLVGVAVSRFRHWRHYSPGTGTHDEHRTSLLATAASSLGLWVLIFVCLVAVLGGGVVYISQTGQHLLALAAVGALVFVGYLTVGIYATAKSRGHPHSHAVAEALTVLGGLGIVAITTNLILA
jgi:hypothetical protein